MPDAEAEIKPFNVIPFSLTVLNRSLAEFILLSRISFFLLSCPPLFTDIRSRKMNNEINTCKSFRIDTSFFRIPDKGSYLASFYCFT